MKAFIAACLILVLLIGSVAANGIVLRGRLTAAIDGVLSLPESLPQTPRAETPAAARLSACWDMTRPLAAFTVSAARIENVNRLLQSLYAGWDAGDDALYRESRGELLLLPMRIRATESFSLENLV